MWKAVCAAVLFCAGSAYAADYPTPQQGDWIAHDFRFHTGQTLPELKLHYTTVGAPAGEPVLVLHGTSQTGAAMLTPEFAGTLFGPGQPLDASKYYLIIPDALGIGGSSKPSDGMRAGFPRYNYQDMVEAEYRLLTEGLGIKHLRLVIGNSMGGMETWVWGEAHPDFMDALVPMASQPTAMAGRNWMMRREIVDAVRKDPAWKDGNYTEQPPMLRFANVFYGIATSGGTLAYQKLAGTHAAADKLVDEREAAPFTTDANDFLYQWDASRDYDAMPGLDRITAPVLVINSADDERNPPETGLTEAAVKRLKQGKLYLIPASEDTRGHGTTGMAKFYVQPLADFLSSAPKRSM